MTVISLRNLILSELLIRLNQKPRRFGSFLTDASLCQLRPSYAYQLSFCKVVGTRQSSTCNHHPHRS